MPVIEGQPLWVWTQLMSIRELTPWAVEDAPADTMALYLAVISANHAGRARADAEAADIKRAQSAERRAQAAERRADDRADGFAAAEAAYLTREGAVSNGDVRDQDHRQRWDAAGV